MEKTKIDWCDSTWNPVTGCLHGCEYCYARGIAKRFGGANDGEIDYGGEAIWTFEGEETGECHVIDKPSNWYSDDGKTVRKAPYPFYFAPTFHRYRLDEYQNKKSRNIFVCSMADLFGEWVPDEWIEEVFAACDRAPQHRYIFLTKNPDRYVQLANVGKLPKWKDNWWFGSTYTNMKSKFFSGGIYWNTFISIEPLLEYMDVGLGSFSSVNWIIIGAETGKRKGKVVPEKAWIDRICYAADITHAAVFMKDSLIPIFGKQNMRREFPWEIDREEK